MPLLRFLNKLISFYTDDKRKFDLKKIVKDLKQHPPFLGWI